MQAAGYCECGCGRKTKLAAQTSQRRGHVKGQPIRYIHGHAPSRLPSVRVSARYGRLVVLRDCGLTRSNGKERTFVCLCDCGTRTEVRANDLATGKTRSCGCLRREMMAASHTTHGLSGTPAHVSWLSMMSRCTNPNDRKYEVYRHRAPCERMRTFEGFFATLGERPEDTSVDRIDNSGGYWCGACPECWANGWPMNVRWADAITQANNH